MMGNQKDDFKDTWANLVPEQPDERSGWVTWLAVGGAILAMICICGTAGFLIVREVVGPGEPTISPIVPTDEIRLPDDVSEPTGVPAPIITAEETTVLPTTIIEDTPAPAATVTAVSTVSPLPTPINGGTEATRFLSPPIIDGMVDEWPGSPSYSSAFQIYAISDWDGSDDLTAIWQLGWDNSNLYIAVEVSDDIHVQTQSGNQIFRGDSVDIQFDTDRAGDFGDGLSPDDFQITLSPGDFGALPPSAFRFQGSAGGRILDAPGGHHVEISARQTAGGYVLEAAIPWSDLALTAEEGLIIGLALNANDNDSPGSASQEVMKSHIVSRTLTDPSGWGTLMLR